MKQIGSRTANSIRRRLLQTWESHGGGFYGFAALLTFLYLESVDIAGDVYRMGDGVDAGFVVRFVIGNMIDAFVNGIRAALWPVAWIQHLGLGMASLSLLGVSYVTFRVIQPAVVRLLTPTDAPARASLDAGKRPYA